MTKRSFDWRVAFIAAVAFAVGQQLGAAKRVSHPVIVELTVSGSKPIVMGIPAAGEVLSQSEMKAYLAEAKRLARRKL